MSVVVDVKFPCFCLNLVPPEMYKSFVGDCECVLCLFFSLLVCLYLYVCVSLFVWPCYVLCEKLVFGISPCKSLQ